MALAPVSSEGENVTASVLTRVLALKNGALQGAAFTLEFEDRQYVVTAKHLFPGTNQVAEVEVYHSNSWKKLPVTIVRSTDADIVVLGPPTHLTPKLPVELGINGIILGQEVFFLGFPSMLSTDAVDANNGFPLPFVKKGALSAWHKGQSKFPTIYVDGINNPGFRWTVGDEKRGNEADDGFRSDQRVST